MLPNRPAQSGGAIGVENSHGIDEQTTGELADQRDARPAVTRVNPPRSSMKNRKMRPRCAWPFITWPHPGSSRAIATTSQGCGGRRSGMASRYLVVCGAGELLRELVKRIQHALHHDGGYWAPAEIGLTEEKVGALRRLLDQADEA